VCVCVWSTHLYQDRYSTNENGFMHDRLRQKNIDKGYQSPLVPWLVQVRSWTRRVFFEDDSNRKMFSDRKYTGAQKRNHPYRSIVRGRRHLPQFSVGQIGVIAVLRYTYIIIMGSVQFDFIVDDMSILLYSYEKKKQLSLSIRT